jgi:hypothetical protein
MFGRFRSVGFVCALAFPLAFGGCGKSEGERDGEAGAGFGDAGSGNGSGGGATIGNYYLAQLRPRGTDKVDLLFMIDNSLSMSDKQRLLSQAIPLLMQRLIQPLCTNANGASAASTAQGCPSGYVPEFRAVEDIHIGIITSSLGHTGSKDVCSETTGGRMPDDKAQLLPSVRPEANLVSWNDQGFLVWDPRSPGAIPAVHTPPAWGAPGGPGDANDLLGKLSDQVLAVGELGCGYEQQLEAWYRFLVDPEPVATMDNDLAVSVRSGTNQLVLAQRAAFLRRDSLLAIVMLTDENDCSIIAENGSRGWLVSYKGGPQSNTWRMPAATNSCKANPNDRCCRPCIMPPEAGCGDDVAEGCPESGYLGVAEDNMNVRCYEQLRRFGLDLLYPTSRYVEAITKSVIDPRMTGVADQPNPLYAPGPLGEPARQPGLVLLAGIVGVPWQDIATDGNVPADGPQPPNSLQDPRALVYLTADQLRTMDRWSVILGEPSADPPVLPTDPHMIESIDPRSGSHPFLSAAAIAPPGAPASSPINGREQAVDPATRDDLQFACIFDLSEPVACDSVNAAGCECNAEEYVKQSPLCTYPAPSMDGTQIKEKAYPSLRELEVLRGVESAGVVASICPKNVEPEGSPASDPYYGYNPAIAAIVNRMKGLFTAGCLPRPLDRVTIEDVDFGRADPAELGTVPCTVLEIQGPEPGGACGACNSAGRAPLAGAKSAVLPAAREFLRNLGQCGAGGQPSCDSYCMCEIEQLGGDGLLQCLTEGAPAGLSGFCYVDPAARTSEAESDGTISPTEQAIIDAEEELTARCKYSERRILRFLGDNLPARGATVVLACTGSSN